jgi:DNA polymerase III gamma/tau subunit
MQQLTDRYRPSSLADLVGNEPAIRVLKALSARPFPSAWLLEGPSGVGKTSAALIIGAQLAHNCMDLVQYNGADITAQVAETIADAARAMPWNGGCRVIIIDEADQMTERAQIAFLSILEHLGSKTIILMTSNEKSDFEPRFLSRLKVIHFTSQGLADAGAAHLVRIAAENGLELDAKEAKKRMQAVKNNIRAALQALELDILVAGAVA